MRISVDRDTCELHGQCTFEAPDVFILDEHDELVYRTEAGDEYRTQVEGAVGLCPARAISVETR